MDNDLQTGAPSALRFSTSGVVDIGFFRTFRRYLTWRTQDINFYIGMGLVAVLTLLFTFFSRTWYVIPVGIVLVLLMLFCVRSGHARMLSSLERVLKERYEDGLYEMTTAFSPEGVQQLNQQSGNTTLLPYDNLTDILLTEDAMALLTRTNALIPVFISQLTRSETEELLAFLREKCPKARLHRA